jgi:hypothetical protein
MARFKDYNWDLDTGEGDGTAARTWLDAQIAVLMDIRDELKQLNRVFACPNAIAIPDLLRTIARNTKKRAPRRKK